MSVVMRDRQGREVEIVVHGARPEEAYISKARYVATGVQLTQDEINLLTATFPYTIIEAWEWDHNGVDDGETLD